MNDNYYSGTYVPIDCLCLCGKGGAALQAMSTGMPHWYYTCTTNMAGTPYYRSSPSHRI